MVANIYYMSDNIQNTIFYDPSPESIPAKI